MKWLESEIQERGLPLREVSRRMGGTANATRIRQYLNQQIVCGPAVLTNLAMAVGVSPIEALWLAGRHEAVFDILLALYGLGYRWMTADKTHLDTQSGANFMGYYIEQARGRKVRTREDSCVVPEPLRRRYHQADIYNYAGLYNHVTLPKPMACAILLAVGLFPRRGERAHEQTRTFIRELGSIAARMLPAAERVTLPRHLNSMHKPFESAKTLLPLRYYGKMRLAVVGEYVQTWADEVCKGYADYARIALYECGSFIGELGESENLWEWQRTAFPRANEFSTD